MKYLLLFFCLLFMLPVNSQGLDKSLKVGDTLPKFEFSSIEDMTISSQDLKGKVVFLNLWFDRCKPCILEMPTLSELKEKYDDRVVFISMCLNNKEDMNTFLEKNNFNFTHLYNSRNYIQNELNVMFFPTSFIIDKSGIIAYKTRGLSTEIGKDGKQKAPDLSYFEKPLLEVLSKKK